MGQHLFEQRYKVVQSTSFTTCLTQACLQVFLRTLLRMKADPVVNRVFSDS